MRVGGELQHISGPIAEILDDLFERIQKQKMEPKPESPPDDEPGDSEGE